MSQPPSTNCFRYLLRLCRELDLLEAIQSLHQRSLIEQGELGGSFTVQSVVLEYGTARLIAMASDEIAKGELRRLLEHGLVLAHTQEYVRQTQERLIAAPILAILDSTYLDRAKVEKHLLALLSQFTSLADHVQGYGPANLATPPAYFTWRSARS